MPAYSFQGQFAQPILDGVKGSTIRASRKAANRGVHGSARHAVTGGHAYPGERLMLYTGMRTKYCRKIADKTCLVAYAFSVGLPRVIVTTDA